MATRAVEAHRVSRELDHLRLADPLRATDNSGLMGRHPTMREVFKLIGKVASSDATV